MEVQQQIPPEAIKLYDLYIHGEIPRRVFMDRLNKFTAAGLALPALVEDNRAAIGKFIEDRINEWHEEKFVAEIEREIGRDLQFIRINGTIVGGLVGLLIYSVSHALR